MLRLLLLLILQVLRRNFQKILRGMLNGTRNTCSIRLKLSGQDKRCVGIHTTNIAKANDINVELSETVARMLVFNEKSLKYLKNN